MASREPRVAIVVLNTDGWPDTCACLDSLSRLEYGSFEVIVVDNGSQDGSEGRIRAAYPNVLVVQTGGNVGFSRGNNAGIRHALERGFAYVWLLNNDTTVEPGAVAALVGTAESDPAIGIVGSAVYFDHDRVRIQAWGGGTYDSWRGVAACAMNRTAADDLQFITGASMLIRRRLLEEIGLLDEAFFLYMEDLDLCFRARRRGWTLAVAPASVVYHKVGATINDGGRERSQRADHTHVRSAGIFMGKHSGYRIVVTAPMRLAGVLVRRALRRQFRMMPALVADFTTGLRIGWQGGAVPAASVGHAPAEDAGNAVVPPPRSASTPATGR